MSAIMIEGQLIHYETLGRGKPILFLHGWLGSWRYWVPVMQEISDRYRAYALDFWGFGDSSKNSRYAIDDYVQLIDHFITKLSLNKLVIVGHALGAVVMLRYAISHPERLDKLLAINLPFHQRCINQRLLRAPLHPLWSKLPRGQSLPEAVLAEVGKEDARVISQSIVSLAQVDLSADVAEIGHKNSAKLLFIYGGNDHIVKPPTLDRLNDCWPNIRAISLLDTQHFPMLEEFAKFTRLFQDFLELDGDLSTLTLKEAWWQRRMR